MGSFVLLFVVLFCLYPSVCLSCCPSFCPFGEEVASGALKLSSEPEVLMDEGDKGPNGLESSLMIVLNREAEKLGSPHLAHSHEMFFRASKTLLDIAMHSLWYHPRQESHLTQGVVHRHAFEQMRQGNLSALGPGLAWMSPARSRRREAEVEKGRGLQSCSVFMSFLRNLRKTSALPVF